MISDLNAFLGTPTGQAWQADYAATGKHITIRPSRPIWTRVTASPGRGRRAGGRQLCERRPAGSEWICANRSQPRSRQRFRHLYNPSYTQTYNAQGGGTATDPPGGVLGHEMIHSLHNGQGNNLAGFSQPSPYITPKKNRKPSVATDMKATRLPRAAFWGTIIFRGVPIMAHRKLLIRTQTETGITEVGIRVARGRIHQPLPAGGGAPNH